MVVLEVQTPKGLVAGMPQGNERKDQRFNGRIADILKTNHFISGEDMAQTLMRYVYLYNHQLPQSALHSRTPVQAMKDCYQTHPNLFVKRPYNRPEYDT